MIWRRSFPSLILLCLVWITLVLIQVPASLGADSAQYTNCSATIQCGTVENISYPFWGVNRADYCGLSSEYQLTCVDNTSLQITISGLTYRVLRVDNSSRIFTAARADYNSTICPQYLYNSSQDMTPFSFSSDTVASNLTLYYGCTASTTATSVLPSSVKTSQFTCNVNSSELTGYFLTRSAQDITLDGITTVADITSYFGGCNTSVVVPANLSAIQTIESSPTTANVEAALNDGFGLQWDNDNGDCQLCIRSGGWCGRNLDSSAFVCYCSDKSSSSTCGGNKNQVSLGIGLGFAGVGITGLLLGLWIYSLRAKRSRKREAAAAAAAESRSKDISGPPLSKGLLPISATSYSRTTPSYLTSKSDLEKGSTYFGVQVFSYVELEEATHNFDPARELGDGGFGTVYYGELHDGRVVAVKRLYENNMKRVEQFMNEVEILTRLRHENLVTLFGCTSRRSRELLLVYEFIPNGTVADHLHGKRAGSGLVPWRIRLNIAIETADALAYLHESDVIHRDVKTNNILLDNNFCVKVADFGLSRLFPNDVTHVSTAPQGTPGYVDPEYYQCYQLTDKSDVYSFGVVLCELLSSKPAVDTNRHRHDINLANMAVKMIQNQTLPELVDPSIGFETDYSVRRMATLVAELAFRCLQQEKDLRPTMLEVLESLRRIKNGENSFQSTEVVEMDIQSDDSGLLKNNIVPPPLSPDSGVTEKWASNSPPPNSF